jgi:hypothetical protein
VKPDQRRIPRAAFDGWVELQVDGARRLATGVDLSQGGIGIALRQGDLAPDTPVVCEFALPGISLPLELDGRIAWARGPRAGVRFDVVDSGLAELLENHVAGRL